MSSVASASTSSTSSAPSVPARLTPGRRRAAVAALRRADPRLAAAIAALGPCRLEPRADGSHFDALVRAIVYQQLSGKAAATIHGRLVETFGGTPPDAAALLAADDAVLRAAGLSRQKLGYLRDLAERTAAGALPLDRIEALPDDAVERALVQVKGIGRWTAQIFLLFRLGRPDVLPEGDLAIQRGIQLLDGARRAPTPDGVRRRGERWAPWRSVAAWYLWRLVDAGGAVAI